MTIEIYDTSDTVALDTPGNGTGLALAPRGWSQGVGEPGPGEVYEDIAERIKLAQLDPLDSTRSAAMKKLYQLGERARDLQDADHIDHLNPGAHVAIKAQTPTETAARWALIKDLRIPKLSPKHYGQGDTPLTLELEREGLWRGIKPGLAPTQLSTLVLNSVEGVGNNNYFTIPPGDIAGDAPGIGIFTIETSANSTASKFSLVRRTATSEAALNTFTAFLWAEDATIKSGMVAKASASLEGVTADQGIPVTNVHQVQTVSTLLQWDIDPAIYYGRFTVYGLYHHYYVGDAGQIRVTHGWSGAGATEADGLQNMVNLSSTEWVAHNLGQVKIPGGGQAIRGAVDSLQDYEITIWSQAAAAASAYLAGIVLVPVDDPYINGDIEVLGYQTVLDGEIERAYLKTVAPISPAGKVYQRIAPYGSYLTLRPGFYNRFYLYPDDGLRAARFDHLINTAINITTTLNYIPRYRGLT